MTPLDAFAALHDPFAARHIGVGEADIAAMLREVGAASLEDLADRAVPPAIRIAPPELPPPLDEAGVLADLRALASQNVLKKSLIGCGYFGTHTPAVVRRNVFENPGWYTAYTPYQPEISQGRLEALLIFQTMIAELTGMEIANASLLDEATAAAEAVAMAHALARAKSATIAVATDVHPQTRAVLETRAAPQGWRIVDVPPGDLAALRTAAPFAVVLQIPRHLGRDPRPHGGNRRCARGRRARDRGDRPARLRAADAAWRDGRRCRRRLGAALRRADGIRRPARRLSRHARCVQADDAGPAGRRLHRRERCAGVAPRAADARAAYPARAGDEQYLHRAGAAGGDGGVLRRLARAGGAAAHRTPRQSRRPAARRCGAARRLPAACTRISSTRSRSSAARRPKPSCRPRSTPASTCAGWTQRASRSRSTRR